MSIFPVLQTAGSGLRTHRIWMDAVADNLANVNTIRPFDEPAFQERFIVAQAIRSDDRDPPGVGGGSRAAAVLFGSDEGRLRYQPEHPYANSEGVVRGPDINVGDQMTQLIMAQRAYQMNLAVVDRARDTYMQALQINGR
ncbi:MAG: flagellar basal body rod protein FlgC [Actinomycetota bacterium]